MTQNATPTVVAQPPILAIILRFITLLLLLNGLYYLEHKLSGRWFNQPYTQLVTLVSAWTGKVLLPFPVDRQGPFALGSGQAAVFIQNGCNGMEALLLLLAGVLAYPATWKQRGQGLLLYLPTLFLLNILRVLLLLYIFVAFPAHIDLFHYQIGQGVLVIFVLAFWVHFVRRNEP